MDPDGKWCATARGSTRCWCFALDPATLSEETRERAAGGIVAYSAICPHAGCEVSGWVAQQAVLECSCHDSRYNPRDAAAVIDGPTPRALPALPLAVSTASSWWRSRSSDGPAYTVLTAQSPLGRGRNAITSP